MNSRIKRILGLFIIALSTVSQASTDPSVIQALLKNQVDGFQIRGTAITVVSGSKSDQFLIGDAKSENSLFEIGSVSKSFAGIVAAQLALEGRLDLEAPISQYLPEVANTFIGKVTARQLATHMARLPHGFADASGKQTESYTEAEFVAFLKNYIPDAIQFPAGKRQYSNLGFSTLGMVISRLENKKYTEVVQHRIFDSLGMKNSGFITSAVPPSGLLQGYNTVLEPLQYDPEGETHTPSGGIYSDLHDMTLYLRANMKPAIDELGQAMQLSQKLGLGWDSDPGAAIIWKNGGMTAGFNSLLKFDPVKETGMIFLANEFNLVPVSSIESTVFGTPDPTASFKDLSSTPEFVKASAGEYFTADGKKEYLIFAAGKTHLGIEPGIGQPPREGPDALYRWRLMQPSPGTFLISQGEGLAEDVIRFGTNTTAGKKQLVYIRYEGVDPIGKPIYTRTNFIQR